MRQVCLGHRNRGVRRRTILRGGSLIPKRAADRAQCVVTADDDDAVCAGLILRCGLRCLSGGILKTESDIAGWPAAAGAVRSRLFFSRAMKRIMVAVHRTKCLEHTG